MPKKILVIEDDIMLRELISKKLTAEGYAVVAAVDGEEGFVLIAKEMPDLVLLDIILPGMDGFEVLKKAKQTPAISQIPIVIISNLSQEEDKLKCMELGAQDYIVKAMFTTTEIMDKIKNILK